MLFATIMAGGAGTRFWPASRRNLPKQLLNLVGPRSMIQSTVDRLGSLVPPENLLIVTNQALVEPIAEQLGHVPRESILGEPAKRDTAPCIGLAAFWVAAQDPGATLIVMPADHVIRPEHVFQQALEYAAEVVESDPESIVTFGIEPTYPADVFGYIERDTEMLEAGRFSTYKVLRFREKPDRATAEQFLQAGTFSWNSGIFILKAQTILKALEQYEPEMYQHLERIARSMGTDRFQEVLETEFSAIKGKSIDFAVMERYPQVLMIEAPFEWDDVGNWSSVPRLQGTDDQGNSINARHIGINTNGSIVRGKENHLIVTIGVQDLIIVETENATLIANKHDESTIKEIVAQLEQKQWNEYL